ncbi:LysR family transcriptional regulator [Neptunicella marina]|uniref:LysR family transcriptional regulator n=1 Tax=Neptunicella marina TaxID=2125989 RepID=A0A8J6ITE6_9ALTE|nr:LysR family transcriptional regulator [Neptunicella marina]MBC3766396.1 LysR family transcriptional regulator [Neptunicella marina]
MKQLSLDNLRTFVTVVDSGGYAKAGELLGRTQPAISLQIRNLEEKLGKKLFSKNGQRHQVNIDGRLLYQQARAMLDINDDIFRQFEQTSLRGRLHLGIPSEFATTLLPGIVGEFSKIYPDVALEVTSALSKSLLNDKQLPDFDLIMALVDPDKPTEGEIILEDDLVWVGNRFQPVPSEMLSLVLAPHGCVYRSRVIDRLKQQTHQWRISYTNADLTGLTAAITQGLGITALSRASVPQELSVIRSPYLPDLGKIKICLFNHSRHHPQATERLAEFIKSRLR